MIGAGRERRRGVLRGTVPIPLAELQFGETSEEVGVFFPGEQGTLDGLPGLLVFALAGETVGAAEGDLDPLLRVALSRRFFGLIVDFKGLGVPAVLPEASGGFRLHRFLSLYRERTQDRRDKKPANQNLAQHAHLL